MTYLQANRRPYQTFRRTILIVLAVLVMFGVMTQVFVPHFFPSIGAAIARPFWRTEFSIESGALKSPEALLAENALLSEQLLDSQVRLDTIRAIEIENNELKTLLGRGVDLVMVNATGSMASGTLPISSQPHPKVSNPDSYILAAVLKRPPFSIYDELVIDIGHDHNLSSSSLVYASGNVMIGHIVDVLQKTAKVKLFSSPGEKFDVLIGPSHAPAVATGRGGGQYEAQVSRDTKVKEGDFVLNSSFSNKPFGVVSVVLLDPTQPFETILFAPPVNMYELRWVLVK